MSYKLRPENHTLLEEQNGATIRKTDAIPFQAPVRLQPSWEESNLPEDELNFKNISMDDAHLQVNPPRDKWRLVYLTLVLHGIGILMPWNMFITAKSYFTDYKLGVKYTGVESAYADSFLQYLGFCAQVPSLIFNWMNIFMQFGGNLTTRIVWSITIEVLVFVFTVILAMSDSHEWPGTFFWATMISVVILNMANGIYQNTVFGMAAKLPFKYTGAVVLGSNISGTFTSVINILSASFASSERTSAIYYFITALFVLLLCFDTYFALPLNRFYRHHELLEQRQIQQKKRDNQGRNTKPPYFEIFQQAFPQLFNVFFIFFVTLSIFPAVHADVKRIDQDFFIPEHMYTSLTCFLTFNVCAMIGSSISGIVAWPKPKYLVIPVVLRVAYIPFYLLCNYQLSGVQRVLPVLVTNDWVYWIVAITMGLTSGYFSSLAMMYTPGTVQPQYASTAGMFAGAALITGIFTGILFSFIWPWFIEHVGF